MADLTESVDLGEISKLKVADLKKELKSRGLSTVGNKTELIERLQLAYDDGGTGLENDSELLDDDDVLAEDDALDDDLSELKSEDSSPTVVLGVKRKAVDVAPTALPVKKIVLNRAAVASAEKENQDGGTVDGAAKVGDTEAAADGKKAIVKISALTAQERLEMRASKFGVSLSPEAKKEARAARFGITAPTTGSATSITAGTAPANVETLKKRAERFGSSVSSTLTKVELDEKLKKRQERFGIVEPATNGKSKTAAAVVKAAPAAVAAVKTVSTSSSSSVKVPITMGGVATSTTSVGADDKKKLRAERFKATM